MSETDRRVVLITGAASGIGAALARRLAGPDSGLVLHTRKNAEGLERVAGEALAAGAEVATALGDLMVPATGPEIVAQGEQRFGRLDALVSNAGFPDWTPVGELDDAGLEASQQAIAGAFLRLVTAALPLIEASPQGRIVAVSSFLAHVFSIEGRVAPASAAAKAALEGLAKSLAVQLASKRITVNCVVPGYIRKDTGAHTALSPQEQTRAADGVPLGRLGLPEEVAALIAYLLSAEAAYITGQSIHIDGGLTL